MEHRVKIGDIIDVTITGIQPYGAFVELDKDLVGLLHIEDIAVSRIKSPSDILRIGEKIPVKIKKFDKDTGRITLNYKDLQGTWEDNIRKFKEKTVVEGVVRNKEKYGVFIELAPNLVGLADMKNESISYGDKVNVLIKKISPDTKKIKLVILD